MESLYREEKLVPMGDINRKRLKKKKRSCPTYKPNKTGGSLRWENKEYAKYKEDIKEVISATRVGPLKKGGENAE